MTSTNLAMKIMAANSITNYSKETKSQFLFRTRLTLFTRHLLSEIKRKMPNDGGSDSPPQYQGMQEEMGMENIVPMSCQGDAGLQNLINRQDQLENAMKMVFTENKRLSKENKLLWTEVTSLKNKQMNTEKATKTINTQNTQLLKENRCLWSELIMNK